MKIILLSGGAGKRLWPFSNDTYSKHFLKFLKNNSTNVAESMLQRNWNNLAKLNLTPDTFIASNSAQSKLIRKQLNDNVNLIIEPSRRDTFPCIALVCSYLYSVLNVSLDENIIISPIDAYVDSDYFKMFSQISQTLDTSNYNLVLLGITPTFASSKYGYIVKDSKTLNVNSFVEKPDEAVASNLIANGALWNCGVFGFKLKYMIKHLMQKNIPINYSMLFNNYNNLPKISFDYQIVEKEQNIGVIPYNGLWKDIGTWDELSSVLDKNIYGNGILHNCSKTHLINNLDIPVAGVGLSDVIISASNDGILISNKSDSTKIKDIVNSFSERPMFEEKCWGYYNVISKAKYNDYEILVKKLHLEKGKNISYQKHFKRAEIWTIVNGCGTLVLNDTIRSVKTGDTINIAIGDKHCIYADTDLDIIEIQTGTVLKEEDIVRLEDRWNEILEYAKGILNEI